MIDTKKIIEDFAKSVVGKTINISIISDNNKIILHNYDTIVENIMQEWLEGWLSHNGIEYASNDNTQMPPDVFLDPHDKRHNLMEVKAFNHNASP